MSKQEQWKKRITKWKAGGESQSAFCRKHKLSHATFKYWRDKLLKAENERFVEIVPHREAAPFEVKLASGALIRRLENLFALRRKPYHLIIDRVLSESNSKPHSSFGSLDLVVSRYPNRKHAPLRAVS